MKQRRQKQRWMNSWRNPPENRPLCFLCRTLINSYCLGHIPPTACRDAFPSQVEISFPYFRKLWPAYIVAMARPSSEAHQQKVEGNIFSKTYSIVRKGVSELEDLLDSHINYLLLRLHTNTQEHDTYKSDKLQESAKEWSLGCVIPASWTPLVAGTRFTLSRDHPLAEPCTYRLYGYNLVWHDGIGLNDVVPSLACSGWLTVTLC